MSAVIVEGPDGSGKTTLIRQIESHTGLKVLHTGGPRDDEAALASMLLLEKRAMDETLLLDRTPHISHPIYRTVTEEPMKIPGDRFLRGLFQMKPVIVFCCAYPPVIKRETRMHKPPEHWETVERSAFLIHELYLDTFVYWAKRLPVRLYDWRLGDGHTRATLDWVYSTLSPSRVGRGETMPTKEVE